eukprot:7625220-Pyramimonas_sp.AAC.1
METSFEVSFVRPRVVFFPVPENFSDQESAVLYALSGRQTFQDRRHCHELLACVGRRSPGARETRLPRPFPLSRPLSTRSSASASSNCS